MARDLGVDNLEHSDAACEDRCTSILISVKPLVHLGERHVLEAKDLRSVVIRDEDAVHVPDASLEAVLEERGADEVVVLPLEALQVALQAADLVSRVFLCQKLFRSRNSYGYWG